MARVDGVRVGEPGLYCGDAQAARARGKGGPGLRLETGAAIWVPRSAAVQSSHGCSGRNASVCPAPAASAWMREIHRLGRAGETAVLFLGPREDDARRRSCEGSEVVGRLADAALGRWQAYKGAIPADRAGVGSGRLRPAALIESAEDNHIRGVRRRGRTASRKGEDDGLSRDISRVAKATCAKRPRNPQGLV